MRRFLSLAPTRAFSTAKGAGAGAASDKLDSGAPVVVVEAVRTPFLRSGTDYGDFIAYDLGRFAIKSLLERTAIEPSKIDHVYMGTVIAEPKTSNLARECALGAGVPNSVPASTVTLACISSNVAITSAVMQIKSGNGSIIVAGGAETMSDVPIRFSRPIRKRLLDATMFKKVKGGLGGYIKLASGLKASDLAPEAPAVSEFSTGEVMGHSADRLCAKFGVTRAEQDAFAVRSHQNAARAFAQGKLKDIAPVKVPKLITADNGVRGDSTLASLASLKPAFIKPHGTVTAANSSYLTDGGSACLVMREDVAKQMGYKPLAFLRTWVYVGQDPKDELLLGPAYGIAKLLHKTGLTVNDVDVWELHEAFAGQVLANLNALDSDEFTKGTAIGGGRKVGRVPMEKLNNWGGSVSIGHPFGATGTRLVAHAAHRLADENGRIAVVAACAAGGHGIAAIVERYPN